MRILIYGAGVIGSLYAVLLKEAGYDTTIYARGHRLEALQNQGLLYKKNNIIKKVDIKVIDYLHDNDIYDFIFLKSTNKISFGTISSTERIEIQQK